MVWTREERVKQGQKVAPLVANPEFVTVSSGGDPLGHGEIRYGRLPGLNAAVEAANIKELKMASSSTVFAASAGQILHEQHAMMREAVTGLSPDALNWQPGNETNSIAQMLSHALESERFMITSASGRDVDRDREGPFRVVVETSDDLLTLIDGTESQLDQLLGQLSDEALRQDITRTTSIGQRTRSGAGWVLQATAHAREHIGQAFLTRQLWESGKK